MVRGRRCNGQGDSTQIFGKRYDEENESTGWKLLIVIKQHFRFKANKV